MIEPIEDQKRKPYEPSQGTPDDPSSGPTSPASATSYKSGIESPPGLVPVAIEQRRMMLAEVGTQLTSIGWLVQQDGRGISIERVREQTFLQNLPRQDQ